MKQKLTVLLQSPFNHRLNIKIWQVFFLFTLAMSFTSQAQTVIITKDADLGSGTYNWTNNNIYMLDGFVFLESGGVLNIEAGTVIKAKAVPTTGDNASALIITVGAKIFATGTATQPIIFTSEADDTNNPNDLAADDRGLWGGLIILGDGVLGNTNPTSNIEGIPTSEPRAQFGGSNNSNNAGVLQYVSIRHGGAELSPGDEINGLTLGGVGSGTSIDYVEVIANLDDGIEIFGGAVNIKHAAVAFCGDDGFDWDMGWVGKGQFWFVLQGPDEADNGGEWDGAIPDGNVVYSNPTVYNLTFIGSGTGTVAATNTNAVLMRDATAGTVANSIFTEYAHKALEVEDLPAASGIDSYTRMQNGELKFLNNLWYGFSNYTTFDANSTTGIIRATSNADDPTCAALIAHLTNNNNQLTNPMLTSISRNPNNMLDPRPQSGSPAFNGLASTPADPFFNNVGYKGAFDGNGSNFWLNSWTALDQYGFLALITSVENTDALPVRSLELFPNPAKEKIYVSINSFDNKLVTLELFDLFGKKILNKSVILETGTPTAIDLDDVSNGIYVIRVRNGSSQVMKRFIKQ